jgi:hypothetical protein
MQLPLVLGVASGRDPVAVGPGLGPVVAGVLNDVAQRFPGAPWHVLTAGTHEAERLAAGAAADSGVPVFAPPPGSGLALLGEACHLLLLVGTGDELEDVARRRLSAGAPGSGPMTLDPPARGPIVRVTRAASGWEASWSDPEEPERRHRSRTWEKEWRRVEAFNQDARSITAPDRVPLLDPAESGDLGAGDRIVAEACEQADALAGRLQRSSRRALSLLLFFAVLATLLLQIGTLARSDRRLTGGLYVASLTAAWAVWYWAKRRDLRAKHLDARALAEGLRVQLFWRLGGVPDSAADHYLRKQRSELDWIRHAVRTVDLEAPRSAGARRPATVQRAWLESQAAWFAAAARRNETHDRYVRRTSATLFAVALALAFLKPFLDTAHPLVVLIGLFPVTAAFVKWWSERRAFGPLARQYERMAILFDAAARQNARALAAAEPGGSPRILFETGCEALAENGDWVLLHRERPLRVPGV